jgi:hypothetical protein
LCDVGVTFWYGWLNLAQLMLITNCKVNTRWNWDSIGICVTAKNEHYSAADSEQQYELPSENPIRFHNDALKSINSTNQGNNHTVRYQIRRILI